MVILPVLQAFQVVHPITFSHKDQGLSLFLAIPSPSGRTSPGKAGSKIHIFVR
jgi:hypothetical protein